MRPTDHPARDPVLALGRRCEEDCGCSPWLDRLLDPKFRDIQPMLDVSRRYVQFNLLPGLYGDDRRLNGVFLHQDGDTHIGVEPLLAARDQENAACKKKY